MVNSTVVSPLAASVRSTAAWRWSGEAARATSSTVSSDTISPAILAKRLTRPTTVSTPSSSTSTTSPVLYQPSP